MLIVREPSGKELGVTHKLRTISMMSQKMYSVTYKLLTQNVRCDMLPDTEHSHSINHAMR